MLLFIYNMAQVRKYQSGGLVQKDEQLIDIGGVKYLKSDVVNIFKNQTLRDSYSKDFVGNDEEQDKLFNQIADIYADGLDSGKMRFDSDGKHILDPSGQYYNIDKIIEKPKTEQDYFNNQSVRVMNMFEIAKKKGYIRSWEGKVNDKTPYSFSETGILTNHYFHKPSDYKWSDLSAAWFALDPMDKTTKVRTFNNRKKVLSEAILKEADLIDNDPSYRKKYRFEGELQNPMAYKEYTKAMRQYAQMIANLNGFNESLLPIATTLGANPRALYSQDQNDTESLFTPVTEEALNYAAQQQQAEKDRLAKEEQDKREKEKQNLEKLQQDIALNGILRNYDPLATQNIRYFDDTTNTFYDLSDDLSKVTNLGQQLARAFQVGYNKEQIQKNWYSWEEFAGKYLQNLTNYFKNKSEYKVYAVTNGPLGNVGKRFFAKRPYDKKPIEVKIKKVGVDYYLYDLKGNQLVNLGEYFYDTRKTAITTIEQLSAALAAVKPSTLDKDIDTGEPIVFSTSQAFGGESEMQAYWQQLGALKISSYDPRRFEEILKGVSMQFLSLPINDQYKYNWFNKTNNPRTWYGTRFALYQNKDNKIVFSWIRGDNEIVFVSDLTLDQFYKKCLKTEGNIKYIAPGFIKKVIKRKVSSNADENKYDIIGYKNGGKLVRFSVGGSLSDIYNNQVSNKIIKPLEAPKQPVSVQQQNNQDQPNTQKNELQKEPQEFTVADGVRLGASILDLTGAFMLFPKGLNLASAAVSGVSLAGYIGADLMDVMEGRQELWPTLKKDAEIAGVQAIALINPVKAGQIAPALAKIVPMVPKIAGLLWTYDILTDDNSRQSIMNTLDKIQHMRISEINSQDLTNLAFIGRTLVGAKMGVKSMKDKAARGINKARRRASDVAEVKYQVKDQEATSMSLVRGAGKQKVDPDIKAIKQRVVDEYNKGLKEGEQAITLEDVTIFNEQNQPITSGKVPLRFSGPDIMSESWAPGRLFERAIQHGDMETGHVTRQNTWLGQRMRNWLGEDFDVSFSDEAIMRRKQQRQIDSLAKNLFGGIHELKRTAQDIANLKNSESFKNASATEQNKQMQDLLTNKGYIFKPKGIEETPLYEGALAKADEIQQVAANLNSMSELEAAGRILGVTDIDSSTVWKSAQPEQTKKLITSEMLRQAYSQFKQAINSNDYLRWLSSQHADLQTLAEHLSTQQPAKGEWKPSTNLQDKLQGYVEEVFNKSSDSQIREKFNAINDPVQQKNFVLAEARKLLAEGKLRGSDMELIQNAYNLVKNSKAEEINKKPTEKVEKTEENSGAEQQTNAQEQNETNKQPNEQLNEAEAKRNATIAKEENLERMILEYIDPKTLKSLQGKHRSYVEQKLNQLQLNQDVKDAIFEYLSIPESLTQSSKIAESTNKAASLKEELQKAKKEKENITTTLQELETKIQETKKQIKNSKSLETRRTKKLETQIQELEEEFHNLRNMGASEEEFTENAKRLQEAKDNSNLSEIKNKLTELQKELDNLNTKSRDTETKAKKQEETIQNISDQYELATKEAKRIRQSFLLRKTNRQKAIRELHRLRHNLQQLNNKFGGLNVPKVHHESRVQLEKAINDLEKSIDNMKVPRDKFGGNLEFIRTITKLQSGGYLPVGKRYIAAVQPNFVDPYGTGWNQYINSWYDVIGANQLKGMLELLNQNKDTWLGSKGWIANQNMNKYTLDTNWTDDYKKNNGSYYDVSVGDYQDAVGGLDPIKQAIAQAYAKARYMLKGNKVSSGEYAGKRDNYFAAITHDMSPFGNINWLDDNDKQEYLKALKAQVGNQYKFVVDKNGYIYPVAADQTDLGEGESWFYSNDTISDNGTLINSTTNEKQPVQSSDQISAEKDGISGIKSEGTDPGRSGSQKGGETIPVTTPNPQYNTNWLDILKLATAQIGTIDARNKIKFRPVKGETYNLYGRVRTGNNAHLTNVAYSSLFGNANTSSDARYNTAVKLNLATNYVKALQDAFAKDREVFYNSLTETQKLQHDNIARQYEMYNTNLQNDIAARKYHDEINEQMTTKLWQNVENYLAKRSVDIDNLNKIKSARYWQIYSDRIENQRNQNIYNTQLDYWNRLSEEEKRNRWDNSITKYLTSAEFKSTKDGIEYDKEIRKINAEADKNIQALIDGLYTLNPQPITYQTTYGSTIKKEGGRITMAKKGSNLNWAKIENARMINKAINESVKEANKSIRSANRELQKTIRSAASMMKKLNTQGLK